MIGIVDLSGGFGNHLFQYSFALYLKKQGVNVYIYNQEGKDYFNHKDFNLKKLNYINLKILKLLKRFKVSKKYYRILTSHEILESKLNIKDLYLESKIISFNGFFQDMNIAIDNLSDIKLIIEKATKSNLNNKEIQKGKTLVHVRRSDYLEQKEELNLEYYIKAINYCQENIENFEFDVFTDDYEWVSQQTIFKNANFIEKSENILQRNEEDVVLIFKEMLNYENYIIANSTYSWWAALLKEDSESIIIQPEPFFSGFNNANLLIPNWIRFPR